ncbi:MAG: tRNA uridine-5-carboxymethylaminomethyl(34) synthesis GTPase MnmE, partial [Bacteroidota bacterium]
VLVSVFHAPYSFTGEESAEISTHGNPLIVQKIMEALIFSGARPAEPGEFTKRAFLNGRLDLTQAEAVADLINARTQTAMRGARNQLDGLLSSKISFLRSELLNSLSLIELELDFAEEEVEFMSGSEIIKKVGGIISEIDNLLSSYSYGRVIRDGVNVAFVGKPNVGKSSLLNFILKEARAIVSEIPGTTRDVLREEVSIEGVLFKLFDTAGLRETADVIEKEGVERSRQAVRNADLVVYLTDIETGFQDKLFSSLSELTDKEKIIKVVNKIDLRPVIDLDADYYISARTGQGMSGFLKGLKERSASSSGYSEQTAIVTNIRHYFALKKTREYLTNSITSIQDGFSGEYISVDLRNAVDGLSEIIGQVTTEDVLNNIFSKFCIGK